MTYSSLLRLSAALSLVCQFAVAQPATPTAQGTLDSSGLYGVQAGDTLYGIATRFGMSVGDLMIANELTGSVSLTIGQGLRIPGQAPVGTEVAAATSTAETGNASANLSGMHRIVRGETLYSIARQYNVSVADISAANGISDPSGLAIGQTLIIPGQETFAPTAPAPTSAPAVNVPQSHTVVAGQTLYAISRQYDVSVPDIRAQNGLSDASPIFIGQVLQIPGGQILAAAPLQTVDVTDPTGQVFLGAVNDVSTPPARSVTSQNAAPLPAQSDGTVVSSATSSGSDGALSVPVTTAPNTRIMLPNPPPRRSSKFHWPARGEVLTRFGAQSNGRQSDGIEIQVSAGQAIRAAEDGVVAFAGTGMVGFGYVVVLEHAEGYHTAYMKNGGASVKRGQTVSRGQTIATAGAEGRLHFEVRHNSEPVNPIAFMVR